MSSPFGIYSVFDFYFMLQGLVHNAVFVLLVFFFCIFISYRLETVSSSFCNSALVHLLVSFFVQCLSDVNF